MSESLKNILQVLECPLLWSSSYWMMAAPSNPGSFLLIACYLVSLHHFETHELRRKSSFIFLHRILFPDLSRSPLPGKKKQASKLHFLLKYEPVSTSVDLSSASMCSVVYQFGTGVKIRNVCLSFKLTGIFLLSLITYSPPCQSHIKCLNTRKDLVAARKTMLGSLTQACEGTWS